MADRTAYAKVQKDKSKQNHLLKEDEVSLDWIFRQTVRPLLRKVKEEVAFYGLTDVVYYCSADGEAAVRRRVYGTVLTFLDDIGADQGARLHVVGQSLGVTVAYDFLFGLFNIVKDHPDFADRLYPSSPKAKALYLKYRKAAQEGRIQLGSFNATASQLPLLVVRSQALVDLLAADRKIETAQIGIAPDGPAKWNVFYDRDDVLGFPTRRLFDATTAIEEYEVNSGALPDAAHSGYWKNREVVKRMAERIGRNLDGA